jgi:hypothetical protein
MFNRSEKAEPFKDDAETRFGAVIEALDTEERLLKALREALDNRADKETESHRLSTLIEAVERAQRNSGEALERWREAVRSELDH